MTLGMRLMTTARRRGCASATSACSGTATMRRCYRTTRPGRLTLPGKPPMQPRAQPSMAPLPPSSPSISGRGRPLHGAVSWYSKYNNASHLWKSRSEAHGIHVGNSEKRLIQVAILMLGLAGPHIRSHYLHDTHSSWHMLMVV